MAMGIQPKTLTLFESPFLVYFVALQKDVEQEKRRAADLTDQLDEKSRQLSKLQTMYDRQKRRPLFPDAASQQGSGRSIFSEDPVPQAAPGIRGDPYQLYQTMVRLIAKGPSPRSDIVVFAFRASFTVTLLWIRNRTRMQRRDHLRSSRWMYKAQCPRCTPVVSLRGCTRISSSTTLSFSQLTSAFVPPAYRFGGVCV